MRHVRLGRTGLQVSRLCLGTMTFGLQCDEPASVAILDRAAEGGITFLDTADVYPLGGGFETVGPTEEILGRWLRGRRNDFVVATKRAGVLSDFIGASRPEQLDDVLAAADNGLDGGLKTRLDDLTREYRYGDDPR
jgi:1-deoxyxylulose-5-phosphate synthase